MKVETTGGHGKNGEALIGSLDPGGYFTLDAMVTPDGPGPLELTITIEYTDDFNQIQTITKTLSVNVIEAPLIPTPDPNNPKGNNDIPTAPETLWQKIWRFILGLFGIGQRFAFDHPWWCNPHRNSRASLPERRRQRLACSTNMIASLL